MIAEFLADEGLRGFHSRLDAARLCESTPHDPLRFRVELPDSAKLPIRDDPVVMVFLHRIGVAMQLEVRIAKRKEHNAFGKLLDSRGRLSSTERFFGDRFADAGEEREIVDGRRCPRRESFREHAVEIARLLAERQRRGPAPIEVALCVEAHVLADANDPSLRLEKAQCDRQRRSQSQLLTVFAEVGDHLRRDVAAELIGAARAITENFHDSIGERIDLFGVERQLFPSPEHGTPACRQGDANVFARNEHRRLAHGDDFDEVEIAIDGSVNLLTS